MRRNPVRPATNRKVSELLRAAGAFQDAADQDLQTTNTAFPGSYNLGKEIEFAKLANRLTISFWPAIVTLFYRRR